MILRPSTSWNFRNRESSPRCGMNQEKRGRSRRRRNGYGFQDASTFPRRKQGSRGRAEPACAVYPGLGFFSGTGRGGGGFPPGTLSEDGISGSGRTASDCGNGFQSVPPGSRSLCPGTLPCRRPFRLSGSRGFLGSLGGSPLPPGRLGFRSWSAGTGLFRFPRRTPGLCMLFFLPGGSLGLLPVLLCCIHVVPPGVGHYRALSSSTISQIRCAESSRTMLCSFCAICSRRASSASSARTWA